MRWTRCALAAICVTTACSFLAPAVFAQNDWIWVGKSSVWSQASNWNVNGEVATSAPTATSNVYIDDGSPNVSVVTVDVIDAAANNLTLDSDDTLTFYSNATLTVSGSATLNGTTNIGLGELRLNGPSTNTGTITLSQVLVTLPSGIQVVQSQGQLDGSGTLTNTGTIQGSGRISLSLTNSGLIVASDSSNTLQIFANVNNSGGIVRGFNGTIALQGATVTGGVVDGNIYANNGAVLNGAQFAGADPGGRGDDHQRIDAGNSGDRDECRNSGPQGWCHADGTRHDFESGR